MNLPPYINVNGEGCLCFKEIYNRSKKEDDCETLSTSYTDKLGFVMWKGRKFLDTKENRVRACKLLWCGIKVSFYLNPNTSRLRLAVKNVGAVLNIRDPEFNYEFVRWRDSELLNYKHPNEFRLK